jgi:acylphosphatase
VNARRYLVRGRVQGVGFRAFVQREADKLGVAGWVRNHENGDVEVYATGTPQQLADLAGRLWKGPRWSEVRDVDEMEAPLQQCDGFRIRH